MKQDTVLSLKKKKRKVSNIVHKYLHICVTKWGRCVCVCVCMSILGYAQTISGCNRVDLQVGNWGCKGKGTFALYCNYFYTMCSSYRMHVLIFHYKNLF